MRKKIIILVMIGFILFPIPVFAKTKSSLSFFTRYFFNKNGTIKENLHSVTTLSESLGLWMNDLILFHKKTKFQHEIMILKKYFLSPHGMIYWEVTPKGHASSEALLDSERIANALYQAATLWHSKKDLALAQEITKHLIQQDYIQNHWRSFQGSKTIPISYLDPTFWKNAWKNHELSTKNYRKSEQFLFSVPIKNGFYPEMYSFDNKEFQYSKIVNLIQQLYIAIHQSQIGKRPTLILSWIQRQEKYNHAIYGQFNTKTNKPIQFQDAAVYAMATKLAYLNGKTILAHTLFAQMKNLQNKNGGYTFQNNGYAFSNLWAIMISKYKNK